jgi:hypothetical protein
MLKMDCENKKDEKAMKKCKRVEKTLEVICDGK